MPVGKIVSSKYRPAWWLPDPHSQTLWPYLFHRCADIPLKPERLELADGDFVDLCWTSNTSGPLVAVFHGLEGNIRSPYATSIMAHIHNKGWRGVFMHFRGCSGEINRLERSYHSGETGDIRYLLEILRQRFPETPIAAIGYSLGGNALLKYLGESADKTPVFASVAISVPYLLHNSADRLSKGLSRLYQWRLIQSLQKKVRNKFKLRKAPFSLDNLNTLNTFYKFDDKITSPLHGFSSADEYYSQSSCREYLARIQVPTLLVHARNDPFMTSSAIPNADELSESVILELSDKGGHAGFVSGIVPWNTQYWLEQRITEFLTPYIL